MSVKHGNENACTLLTLHLHILPSSEVALPLLHIHKHRPQTKTLPVPTQLPRVAMACAANHFHSDLSEKSVHLMM